MVPRHHFSCPSYHPHPSYPSQVFFFGILGQHRARCLTVSLSSSSYVAHVHVYPQTVSEDVCLLLCVLLCCSCVLLYFCPRRRNTKRQPPLPHWLAQPEDVVLRAHRYAMLQLLLTAQDRLAYIAGGWACIVGLFWSVACKCAAMCMLPCYCV